MSRKNKLKKLERRYLDYNRTYWRLSHNALVDWLEGGFAPEPNPIVVKMRAINEQYILCFDRYHNYKRKKIK